MSTIGWGGSTLAPTRHGPRRGKDKSGFAPTADRPHGWAPRGQRIYGKRSGQRHPRTSLIRHLLAQVLFEGYTNARGFTQWLVEHPFPVLPAHCTVVLDNAAFHKTARTQEVVAAEQHHLLFLVPYSPNFNPIEEYFATLKKHRHFAPPGTSLDTLVALY